MSKDMRGEKIDVLDHGLIRIVDFMGNDESIVRAARVSYDAAWRAGEDAGSDARLIKYLWANKHVSPFESVAFTFEVKAPIFVFRQWHRHRSWSFSEISARYCELPEEFYLPDPAVIGVQSKSSKQARDIVEISGLNLKRRKAQVAHLKFALEESFKVYRTCLEWGWPRELARSVLPVSTYSHMFATCSLRSLFHFMDLRCDSHSQYEIRVYADAVRELIRPIVPVALSAWENK